MIDNTTTAIENALAMPKDRDRESMFLGASIEIIYPSVIGQPEGVLIRKKKARRLAE